MDARRRHRRALRGGVQPRGSEAAAPLRARDREPLTRLQGLDVRDEVVQLVGWDDPPQGGIETIGARPITAPLLITAMIFASVLNWCRKAAPDRGGIVLSGDCGFGTPPSPFGPWQLMQPKRV